MSLRIIDNELALNVAIALGTVCPEPSLFIDRVTGEIFLDGALSRPGAPGVFVVSTLINSSCSVSIRGDLPTAPVPGPGNTIVSLGEKGGGFVIPNGSPATAVEVIIDATFCGNRGYFFPDPSGQSVIGRLDITLFHELGHAVQWCRGVVGDLEAGALSAENEYRASIGFPLRRDLTGSGPCVANTQPPPDPGAGSPRVECFVATAALGSPSHDDVVFLRRFRDEVLRKTRSGFDFFESFYQEYYRLSPAIVRAMNERPELRDAVRAALVTPLVNYLRIAAEMPDAPLGDVPEPWRTFLSDLGENLASWADQLPLRTDLSSLDPRRAVEEVTALLRYTARTPERRSSLLSALEAAGSLPLHTTSAERAALAAELGRACREPEEVRRILGVSDAEEES